MTWNLDGLQHAPHVRYVMDGEAPAAVIELPRARARVSLIGAQVMSFETLRETGWQEHLWLSPQAKPQLGKALRGGIPICWPWFGPHATHPNLLQHGCARTALWQPFNAVSQVEVDGTVAIVTFRLPETVLSTVPGLGAGDAAVLFSVLVHDNGTLALKLTTRVAVAFTFSQVFHSYFRVGDVRQVRVDGLAGGSYRDQADANTIKTLTAPFDFSREVNAHFPHRGGPLCVLDPVGQRRITIDTGGAHGTTVWHPGPDASQKFADIPAEVAHHFVCVESGNLPEKPVMLQAGDDHELECIYAFGSP